MYGKIKTELRDYLNNLKVNGLYKNERIITSQQGAVINTTSQNQVLNFCSNNYLGLAANTEVMSAALNSLESFGYGLSSVRFICGTQSIHRDLEKKIAQFLGMDDSILYAAAFDANGGLFEPLMTEEDVIISDELNHASIIDGIRLSKARRLRYRHDDMNDLESQLKLSSNNRRKLIVTDGTFSMDGTIAQLDKICDLADRHDALVMVDDCHSTGIIGNTGRGTHEYRKVVSRVDIITGTLGKALGGAMGGFTAARQEIVDLLRQRSRPYLFSNTIAPSIVGATLKVLEMLSNSSELRDKLHSNTAKFRQGMKDAGFEIVPGEHPIVPIMVNEAPLAQKFAQLLLEEGIYVIGFFYPVVPKGKARIRVQLSAAHEPEQISKAIQAFSKVGKELGILIG